MFVFITKYGDFFLEWTLLVANILSSLCKWKVNFYLELLLLFLQNLSFVRLTIIFFNFTSWKILFRSSKPAFHQYLLSNFIYFQLNYNWINLTYIYNYLVLLSFKFCFLITISNVRLVLENNDKQIDSNLFSILIVSIYEGDC